MHRKRVHIWDLSHPSQGVFLFVAIIALASGMLAGFSVSVSVELPFEAEFTLRPEVPISLFRFLGLFWSHYRWLLLASLLAMTALGLFLLYPLVFLRGLLIGFSFSNLFVAGTRGYVLLHFLCTMLFTVAPLLVCAACGAWRTCNELRRGGGDTLLDRPWFPLLMLLFSLMLSFLCSCAELWLLPGFVSYIQPVT